MEHQNTALASLLSFREKRKWQIALRRYVIEQQKSSAYAPYFGLDIQNYRKWIELQFDAEANWETFGKVWQLDHIIPVGYFDFAVENDLRLCWNFINIRVEKTSLNNNRVSRVDVLTAKAYFEDIFKTTALPISLEMIRRIEHIEATQSKSNKRRESFIKENFQYLTTIQRFTRYEFDQLNMGVGFDEIELQRKLVQKYSR